MIKMDFINWSQSIGQIVSAGATNLTGSVESAVILIVIFVMIIGIMFNIPLEFLGVLILPLCLTIAAFYGSIWVAVILILVYVSVIIAKNWLFR